MKYISSNIKVLRQEARLSFEDLSLITSIEVEKLKMFEKGKIIPTLEEVRLLCKPLRISFDDIIERDILQERNDAGKRMRKSADRNNYNWYLGNRKVFALYLIYFILVILGLAILSIASKVTNIDFFLIKENNIILPTTWIEAVLSSYIVMSYPVGVCFLVWLLIKIRYRFVWWHIFWLSFVISLIPVAGVIVMLPSIGYSFYKSIIKRGKN